MKRWILGVVMALTVVLAAVSFVAPVTAQTTANAAPVAENAADPVLAARFLNMLNHNFVYDADFESVDAMVNDSVLALLDRREDGTDFIAVGYVADYMKAMYGIEIADADALNAGFPHRDGYIYVIPRGFADYRHEFVSATENEDGSFTVYTDVTVDCHDGEPETYQAVSLFVPNADSVFGYHLITCDILTESMSL